MAHRRFPDRLAFILNNPIRRFLAPAHQLISKLNVSSTDVAVDFGCGPGFFTVALARIAAKTIGVDISSRMLERAAAYARKSGVTVEFMQSDGTAIKLDEDSVDLILLAHVFHEAEHRPRVLGEFLRILKPLGRLAIVETTSGNCIFAGRLGPPVVKAMEVVQEITQAGFSIVGTIPHGKASVIIGQKMPRGP